MGKPTVRLSQGAEWVVERMLNTQYPEFQKEMEDAISRIMFKYGYDNGIAMAFREHTPVYVERSE
ncbi:hypothetical protein [Salmonella phage SSBI34]|nr:hypothetical protein [Salmonella phage SSBI34]